MPSMFVEMISVPLISFFVRETRAILSTQIISAVFFSTSSSLLLPIIFFINRNISGRHYFAKSLFGVIVNRLRFGISFSGEEGMVARITI